MQKNLKEMSIIIKKLLQVFIFFLFLRIFSKQNKNETTLGDLEIEDNLRWTV